MVLCAVSKDHSVVRLLEVPESAAVGEKVVFKGFPADSVPATPAQMAKKKILEGLAPGVNYFIYISILIGESTSLLVLLLCLDVHVASHGLSRSCSLGSERFYHR